MDRWEKQNAEAIIGSFKIVSSFEIPHVGWEMDNRGWIVETEDSARHFLTSSHGSIYLADRAEAEEIAEKCRKWAEGVDAALVELAA